MDHPNTVSALLRKRAEIAGQVEHAQAELRRLVGDLAHVEATIRLFAPEIDFGPQKVKPVPPAHQAFRGEVSRIVLEALRAAGGPVTTEEIAERLMAARGLDSADDGMRRVMVKRAGACLRNWRQKGLVTARNGEGQFKLWEAVR